ncbi:hypothetical protein [Niveibacterium microcysteis]|uniref:Uncharacterized protein n=1 Tax=Niveibacterium microcysteis TaxID=2811415 RepID=A0ABX7MAL2_9RHOO|nr:hypothetical protein [Niveibacterium microcysteis]QSI78772.1 hypothetical protein JY500_09275 [Niveibacterium microcysteis]
MYQTVASEKLAVKVFLEQHGTTFMTWRDAKEKERACFQGIGFTVLHVVAYGMECGSWSGFPKTTLPRMGRKHEKLVDCLVVLRLTATRNRPETKKPSSVAWLSFMLNRFRAIDVERTKGIELAGFRVKTR